MRMIKIIDNKGKIIPHIMTILPLDVFEKRNPDDMHRCGHFSLALCQA